MTVLGFELRLSCYSVSWLVCLMETDCVLCVLRTQFLRRTEMNFSLEIVHFCTAAFYLTLGSYLWSVIINCSLIHYRYIKCFVPIEI
jgi:hypothetical protein